MPIEFVVRIHNSKSNEGIIRTFDLNKSWSDYRNVLKEVQKTTNSLLTEIVEQENINTNTQLEAENEENDSSEDDDSLKRKIDHNCNSNKKIRKR